MNTFGPNNPMNSPAQRHQQQVQQWQRQRMQQGAWWMEQQRRRKLEGQLPLSPYPVEKKSGSVVGNIIGLIFFVALVVGACSMFN